MNGGWTTIVPWPRYIAQNMGKKNERNFDDIEYGMTHKKDIAHFLTEVRFRADFSQTCLKGCTHRQKTVHLESARRDVSIAEHRSTRAPFPSSRKSTTYSKYVIVPRGGCFLACCWSVCYWSVHGSPSVGNPRRSNNVTPMAAYGITGLSQRRRFSIGGTAQ